MAERPENYPPAGPQGTQPAFPQEGIPSDPVVGDKMGTREAEDEAHGSTDSGDQDERSPGE